ncbi:MAG: hypothetical protein ACI8TX_002926 [Hyphomicrobiaceae bacterium]|jgi:hypothetical protein
MDESVAVYTGNVLANAQALVAKAALANEFPNFLDVTRLNITQEILNWIESGALLSTLVAQPSDYLCNGDTMFHVNKGVIGFKMDGAKRVSLTHTSARNLENLGVEGTADCGNYSVSHQGATLAGYGGSMVRAYSFAGSEMVKVRHSDASNLSSVAGSVVGFDILTDTKRVSIKHCSVVDVDAGTSFASNGGPNALPDAIGVLVGEDATEVDISHTSTSNLSGYDESISIRDLSGSATY